MGVAGAALLERQAPAGNTVRMVEMVLDHPSPPTLQPAGTVPVARPSRFYSKEVTASRKTVEVGGSLKTVFRGND